MISRCPYCGYEERGIKMRLHLESVHFGGGSRFYVCLECDYQSENASDVREHFEIVHANKEKKGVIDKPNSGVMKAIGYLFCRCFCGPL